MRYINACRAENMVRWKILWSSIFNDLIEFASSPIASSVYLSIFPFRSLY